MDGSDSLIAARELSVDGGGGGVVEAAILQDLRRRKNKVRGKRPVYIVENPSHLLDM